MAWKVLVLQLISVYSTRCSCEKRGFFLSRTQPETTAGQRQRDVVFYVQSADPRLCVSSGERRDGRLCRGVALGQTRAQISGTGADGGDASDSGRLVCVDCCEQSDHTACGFCASGQRWGTHDGGGTPIIFERMAKAKKGTNHLSISTGENAVGLLPYIQVLLFARLLRGDLDAYLPILWK